MDFDPSLTPIGSESGNAVRTPVRVMVHLKPDEHSEHKYTVCVGDGAYRYYSEETVPTEIKSLLGMVKAFPEEIRMYRSAPGIQRYIPPDPRLKDIGWQLKSIESRRESEWYMLIVSNEIFEKMRFTNGRYS